MNSRLIANFASLISGYKKDVDDATVVGNFSLDTDVLTFTTSWSNDRANNRTITSGTVISDVPNLNGDGAVDITLSADVTAKAKTKEGRRLYRVIFRENDVRYDMVIDADNKVIDRRG